MIRPPHACIAGKFLSFKAAELRHGCNDRERIMALVWQTNDNDLRGRPA